MNRTKILTSLFAVFSILNVGAQQHKVMTIEELFNLAESNSKSLKVHNLAVDEAIQAVKVAKNDKLPSIEASLSFSYIGDG